MFADSRLAPRRRRRGNITPSFGVVGEGAGHYKSLDETRTVAGIQVSVSGDARFHTFMGGFTVRQNPRFAAGVVFPF